MLLPRIIPTLLIDNSKLVKTKYFKPYKYIGDPINALKIFNELKADETIVLDIGATVNQEEPNYKLIAKLARESTSPLCYGGGIKTCNQALKILDLGVEKVSISSIAIDNPDIINLIANYAGSQSVVCAIDTKRNSTQFGTSYPVFTHNGNNLKHNSCINLAKTFQNSGAGEIIINSIDRDGEMLGYDIDLAIEICNNLTIPVTFLGGAGSSADIVFLLKNCGSIGAAAGSLFVFKGIYDAVLINYPSPIEKAEIFLNAYK